LCLPCFTFSQIQVTLDDDYKLSAIAVKSSGATLSERQIFKYPPMSEAALKTQDEGTEDTHMHTETPRPTLESWMKEFL
jgi:hypothetical protein